MSAALVALRRLAAGVAVVLTVSLLVFLATSLRPGDSVRARLGALASDAQVRAEEVRLGLDRPLPERYWSWLSGVLRGDFGASYGTGAPVRELVAPALAGSLALVAVAIVVVAVAGTVLGFAAGLRPGGALDRFVLVSGLTVSAVPAFVTGAVLVLVFAVGLRWLPAVSLIDPDRSLLGQPAELVLPVVTLALSSLTFVIRLVRARVLDAGSSDWALAARLRGVPEPVVLVRHVLPAVGPVLCQVVAFVALAMLSGAVVVELVFGYPGIGQLLQNAVAARDVPVVQAVSVLVAALVVLVNVTAEIVATLLVPQSRQGDRAR